MKRLLCFLAAIFLFTGLAGCQTESNIQIVATTAPVYEFTSRICSGSNLRIGQIVTENVSCLHDYTLQTSQMRMVESAQVLILSGAGLEGFLTDALSGVDSVIDTSQSIELICSETDHSHDSHDHHHDHDPHIWLSPANAGQMARNICAGLEKKYPQYAELFSSNLESLLAELAALEEYGKKELGSLSVRRLITFHDGFSYLADAFDLEILHAIEEESGSEASAAELIDMCHIVDLNNLPAIFTERNGSTSAAQIISAETNTPIYQLDMAMSEGGYFDAMYYNINTLKEALG